jgi:asparagine synthase (glutamine-hydrolysing)
VACDADLCNEDELEEECGDFLQAPGASRTAALLAALYERHGSEFLNRLRGAFSIILWDRVRRQLIAAVDRFGMKRLAYHESPRQLLVASRIDALARTGEIELDVDPRAIPNIVNFSSNLGPGTIFSNIQRIPPGSMLVCRGDESRIVQYWDMRYAESEAQSESSLSQELEALLDQSVAAHCKTGSFAKTGAFLSGGTDSSTVVGLMNRTRRGQVKAFSIGFKERQFNELSYAQVAARKFNAEHHTYLVGPEDCFEALTRMVAFFDEPFGNSSAIPTYFCARLAADQGVKVLLAGDGGDELFGGNERYATDKIFEMYHTVPSGLRERVIEPILSGVTLDKGLLRKLRNYVRRAKMPGMERLLSFQFLATSQFAEVFNADFLHSLRDYSIFDIPSRYYNEAPAHTHLDRVLYADVKITLGDSDLLKVTYMSELAGIQARFPFLDHIVAEFSGRIPARLKVKGFKKRYLFKQAFKNLLPAEILAKKKHGFGIPVASWLRLDPRLRALSHDILLSKRSLERGYFQPQFIKSLFRQSDTEQSSFHGDILWAFLALELWHHQNVDQPVRMAV